jgi:hypothetical protein
MTDQIQDQEVELEDEIEIEEAQAHDPKNAEAQSIASVKGAEGKGKTAKEPGGKGGPKDPMQKLPGTKAGMINAMYMKASKMKKEELAGMYAKLMGETVLEELDADDQPIVEYQSDFSQDLDALIESEATLSEEFKAKTAVIFEAVIKSKLAEEIDRLEDNYATELEEEISATKTDMVEKVDSYLNYVVENWMEENKLAVQSGLRTEIAEKFMTSLKDLFTESYIEVPESKVDLVDELALEVEELEEALNNSMAKAIETAEELEEMKRYEIIREASKDLAATQVEKLAKLVEDITFEDIETFSQKVQMVKESYFKKDAVESVIQDSVEDDDGNITEATGTMAQYLTAIRKSAQT